MNIQEIDTIYEPREIFDCIEQHNPDGAAKAMYEHLEKGRDRMIHNLLDTRLSESI
ncbi:hypothetical protein [Marispirochaeta sp.]|uniref:hypothetical protein n=1 Tax=Marispirochaeta sp. TaxID=2038653 RepID=UPI0029C8D3AD|nr:hypothetical protein [Marispirochaeta sp.]